MTYLFFVFVTWLEVVLYELYSSENIFEKCRKREKIYNLLFHYSKEFDWTNSIQIILRQTVSQKLFRRLCAPK